MEVDLPVELFDEQIAHLAAEGTAVTLDEGLRRLAADEHPRERMVALTFDDGTADFADVAVPVLARHGVPVTVYVATAFVDEQLPFPDDGAPVSWAGLRDSLSTGVVQVGSHTHSHALLDRIPPEQVADELDRSVGLIRERLGVPAVHFAYPKAVAPSADAEVAVRARFRSAALAGTRPNRYGATDPYRLARSPIQVRDGMRWFVRKARGGLELEDQIRRRIDRRRYREAIT